MNTIDLQKKYTVPEIVQLGLISTPTRTSNPVSIYQYVLRLIKSGTLTAEETSQGVKSYLVLGEEIVRFINK